MSTPIRHRHESPLSPNEVWQALNTPLPTPLANVINPFYTVVEYEDLGEEGRIQQGTRIIYKPDNALLHRISPVYKDAMLQAGKFCVESYDAGTRTRVDVPEGPDVTGSIRRQVDDSEAGTALLLVSGQLAIGGPVERYISTKFLRDAEETAVQYGVRGLDRRFLEHVPEILAA